MMVVVERRLRWNKKDFQPGVAVDMPVEVMATLPEGVVRPLVDPTAPPVVDAPEVHQPPFMPTIRPLSS
jgi:hypothetical protein